MCECPSSLGLCSLGYSTNTLQYNTCTLCPFMALRSEGGCRHPQHSDSQTPEGESWLPGTLHKLAQAAKESGSAQRELMTLPRCQPLGHCFSPAPELVLELLANE